MLCVWEEPSQAFHLGGNTTRPLGVVAELYNGRNDNVKSQEDCLQALLQDNVQRSSLS